jgi:hypothetical protein
LAHRATTAGWAASATRSFSPASRSLAKSNEACAEPVIDIMSGASRPRAERNGRMTA